MSDGPNVVTLDGVTKSFGRKAAVDDLSFHVKPGEILGFLGQNGAGKTTTLRMILGITQPDSGRMTVLGAPNAQSVRARVGYLPEERGLYKKMRADQNIAYFAALKGLAYADGFRRGRDLLKRFGLGDAAHRKVEGFSKGMAQKVQILATIAHDPELVILDEPFSGLDPINQQTLEDLIRGLKADGKTVIFSTHTMQHAERLCDRLLMIAHGRKVFEGDLGEARRALPRRVRIRGEGDFSGLADVAGVAAVHPPAAPGGMWELEVAADADAQAILAECMARGLALSHFDAAEPSLHDIFVALAGPAPEDAAGTSDAGGRDAA